MKVLFLLPRENVKMIKEIPSIPRMKEGVMFPNEGFGEVVTIIWFPSDDTSGEREVDVLISCR